MEECFYGWYDALYCNLLLRYSDKKVDLYVQLKLSAEHRETRGGGKALKLDRLNPFVPEWKKDWLHLPGWNIRQI